MLSGISDKDETVDIFFPRGLTLREYEVALLLARGERNAFIARKLSISVKTVDTHRQHLLSKIGVENNSQLTLWAVELGIIPIKNPYLSKKIPLEFHRILRVICNRQVFYCECGQLFYSVSDSEKHIGSAIHTLD